MAIWKKVIVSGSIAELNTVSASLAVVVGANGYNKIGVDQATTKLSGSFTGSFKGDGSGLTGLVTTLGITGSDNTFSSVDLLTQNLTVQGVNTEINTTISGQTLTIGLVDNPSITGDITIGGNTISSSTDTAIELTGTNVEVRGDLTVTGNDIKSSTGATNITLTANTLTTFAGDIKVNGNDISSSTATALTLDGENVKVVGDLTVGGNDIKSSTDATAITLSGANVSMPGNLSVSGDLTVTGDLTYLNVTNLAVEDKFILLNSGSANPDEAGLVVDTGNGIGYAFAFDAGESRWGFSGSFDSTTTSFAPDAYVAAVVTSDIPAYQKAGNMRIESGEIYIYV
jgi:uncharacterized Zn-binding protein involved in type VI secretion